MHSFQWMITFGMHNYKCFINYDTQFPRGHKVYIDIYLWYVYDGVNNGSFEWEPTDGYFKIVDGIFSLHSLFCVFIFVPLMLKTEENIL